MGLCHLKGHLWGLPTNSDGPEFQESLTKRDFFLPHIYGKISNVCHFVQAAELMPHYLTQFAEILEISTV